MNKQRHIDLSIGIFILAGLIAFIILAVKVSGITHWSSKTGYHVYAVFTDIGGLKTRAPVTIAGVKVGEVTEIVLQQQTLNAQVTMLLYGEKQIPFDDTSVRILTEGLIGANYISIVPGFETNHSHPYLRDGDTIAKTQDAVILENIIGQLLFNIKK